jgi:hypothetical protein
MDVPKDTWPSKSAKRATRPNVYIQPAPCRGFFVHPALPGQTTGHSRHKLKKERPRRVGSAPRTVSLTATNPLEKETTMQAQASCRAAVYKCRHREEYRDGRCSPERD